MSFEQAARELSVAERAAAEATKQLVAASPWHITICEGIEALDIALATETARGHLVRFVLPNGINRWTVIACPVEFSQGEPWPSAGVGV